MSSLIEEINKKQSEIEQCVLSKCISYAGSDIDSTVVNDFIYRKILQRELGRRQIINSSYSLRAYARDLGVSASRLSEIFSGKNGLSLKNAGKFAKKLKLEGIEHELFLSSVVCHHSRSPRLKRDAESRILKLLQRPREQKIREDEFELIAQWYHLAMIELLSLRGFKFTIENVSRKLGITRSDAKSGIERLLRLGWLKKGTIGYTSDSRYRTINFETPSQAARSYHLAYLYKGLRAVEEQTPQERDLHSLVLAIKKSNYEKAKVALNDFCIEFNKTFGARDSEGDELYSLSMQFFRVGNPMGGNDAKF